MMVNEPHLRTRGPESLPEFLRATLLMPHAQKMQRGIQPVEVRQRHLAHGVTFQIVAVHRSSRLPAETDFVQLVRADFGKIQARANGILRKSRVVFETADAL